MGKSCCFLGNVEQKDIKKLQKEVKNKTEKLISENGVTDFFVAGDNMFEFLGCYTVYTLCTKYPEIKASKAENYERMIDTCDFCVVYLDGKNKKLYDYALKKKKAIINIKGPAK